MKHLARRAILALVLLAGIVPAFAQAPGPVPALPDSERRTTYSLSGTNCTCAVNFAIYGDSTDYAEWLTVWVNGVQLPASGNWSISSPSGSLSILPRPITDAVLTFTAPQTGTVQIVGAQRPRRTTEVAENQGVAARDFNLAMNSIVAMLREVWDKINDVTGRVVRAPAGETLSTLPPVASRANMGSCFDSGGNLVPCVGPSTGTFAAGNGINFTGTNPTTISAVSVTNPVSSPQGRLTLTSGVAVPTTSVSAATRLYYTPSVGTSVPMYDGSNLQPVNVPEIFQDTIDTSQSPAAVAASSCYDNFAWNPASAKLSRGPAWTNVTTRSAGTALVLVNGIFLNAVSITNGPAASRGTYVGTFCSNATSTIDWVYGASGGSPAYFGIWNAYNRVPVSTGLISDQIAPWTYNVANTWRVANAAVNTMYAAVVRGFNIEAVTAEYIGIGQPGTGVVMFNGVGIDGVTPCGRWGFINSNATALTPIADAKCTVQPGIGQHKFFAIEQQSNATVSTWFGTQPATGLTLDTWQ